MERNDFAFNVSTSKVPGVRKINKFGYAPSGAQTTATDIWSRADATPTQQIWLAPTAARIHSIVSSSASDAGSKGILTLAENAANGNTVTIGTKVYTFQDTLTNVDGNVKIGATASDTIDNLIAAINLSTGAGTLYAASMTAINGKAFAGAGDTMNFYGFDGTALATTDTLAGASAWGAATTVIGVGAISVTIYGLKTWDTTETSETVYLCGTDAINTVNSYVIIHRMVANAHAGTTNVGINVGAITATAATNSTITAVILASEGQTQMAIYGVPSVQDFYLKRWGVSIDKASGAAVTVDFEIRVNHNPNVQTVAFVRKENLSLQSTGTSSQERVYDILPKYEGPCIIKLQCVASAADVDVEGGFDGYLVKK